MGLSLSTRDKDWAPANEILDKNVGPAKLLELIERLLTLDEGDRIGAD